MSSKLDSAQISFLRVILNCVKNLRVEEERNGTKKIVWFKQTFLITKQNKTKAKKKKRGDFDWHFLLKCVNKTTKKKSKNFFLSPKVSKSAF